MKLRRLLTTAMVGLGLAGSAAAANLTSYYLFDGDGRTAWEITNGAVANTFSTYALGYPPAIRSSIWLGQRDDREAREYSLAGVATGNTSTGGAAFSQLLDGATGTNGRNYGVECCGGTNSVTVANSDWSNQTALFNLSGDGAGIAFDPTNSTLYVSLFGNAINHYDLSGALLGTIDLGRTLVGLAYEELTNSFWGWDRSLQHLVQFDRTGGILQDFFVDGIGGNPFGGEMAVTGGAVPEPGTVALLAMGLLAGVGAWRRRQPAAALHGQGTV